jgi:hypothetical protein
MKKTVLTFVSVLFIFVSCKDQMTQFTVPDYKSWKRPAAEILDTPIPGHGESYRLIYANDIAFQSKIIKDGNTRRVFMNDGSVIVKEVYEKREDVGYKVPGLFIMKKDIKYPEALNGWVYYMKKPGEPAMEIKWRMCVGCHEAANEKHPYFDRNKEGMFRDYLFVNIAR